MNVDIAINRSAHLNVPASKALALLQNVEAALRCLPKLAHLRDLGGGRYTWKMKTIGSRTARVAYDAKFGAQTVFDQQAGRLAWTPVKGAGNAELAGEISVTADGGSSRLSIKVSGTLRDVPVPLLYRPMAAPFIRGKFIGLADGFLENASLALTSPQATPADAPLRASGAA